MRNSEFGVGNGAILDFGCGMWASGMWHVACGKLKVTN